MDEDLNKLDDLSRRKFLHYTARTLLGVGLASMSSSPLWANATAARLSRPLARNVIYIYLAGGMSHLDTFDPKPNTKAEYGPVGVIPTNIDGIQVSEWLPGLAKRMNHLALIRSMTSTQGAHESGTYFMRTSYAPRGTIQHPGLGAWLMSMSGKTNTTLPGNVRIGGSGQTPGREGFLEKRYAPLFIGNPDKGLRHVKLHKNVDETELQERLALAQMMDMGFHQKYSSKEVASYGDIYEEAIKLMTSEDLDAFNLRKEPDHVRERYGNSSFGKGCLLARRLVENGVRYVEVNKGGWDTHNDNHKQVEILSYEIDQVLSALIDDLYWRGLLDETLIVVATEFGRSPSINRNQGRDHHPRAFSCMLAGGGINGGQVFGATDEHGGEVAEKAVTIPDFNATIAYSLGLPTDQPVMTPSGRPMTVADKGEPLRMLF
ncbi:DUF1501 domain-containing protein [Cerasicoccus arenae]|uniref:DUF1501 domain-containing protein n=1 Tax=Cerasicoccus arenae TaxID=424488 RepID=A0A8J3DGN0_9BACT|nr:DUF1501 domain-containing protein [Cerasicoccus arenae]MBK1856778.1 DUF1501 domain-containing protein [Cerasicoccus arenae]GHB99442.1 hypothetical protein GCM10007047_14610 [Cerasicoccus arenae]